MTRTRGRFAAPFAATWFATAALAAPFVIGWRLANVAWKRRVRCVVIAILLVIAIGPAVSAPADDRPADTVMVFAAASLTEAFRAIAMELQTRTPPLSVEFNFAGTPTLVQQIEQGAPADVIASADEPSLARLGTAGLLAGTPVVFARNRLAIAVAPGNPKHVTGLADLGRPGLTVALCAPTVPAGRYAAEAFGKAGIAVPAASRELDVKAVLARVAFGEADGGVVYVTDVRAAGEKVQAVDIPDAQNALAAYPAAVVASARNPAGARAFVDFLASQRGQQVLGRFGFAGR